MKIALVNTFMPFLRGGAEILVDDLKVQLQRRGHQVMLFRLPFPSNYEVGLMELVLGSKLLDFTSYDKVVAFKFPAYCVIHRNKTLWIFHQFRQVYELYGTLDGLEDSDEARALQKVITELDGEDIGGARRVYVNADEVANRLYKYNRLKSEVLTPPLLNYASYHLEGYGDYIYYPSRVTTLKRQHLAIEAMRYVKSDVKLVIAGRCMEPEYEKQLQALIRKHGLEDRVKYENRWVEDEEKLEMIAGSLAMIYIPYLEDSCGFVTIEGFYSSKAVLTCYDSGGTKEFVEEGITGYFAQSTPQALAEKMDLLYQNRAKTIEMGKNARKEIERRNITWDETVRRLLS